MVLNKISVFEVNKSPLELLDVPVPDGCQLKDRLKSVPMNASKRTPCAGKASGIGIVIMAVQTIPQIAAVSVVGMAAQTELSLP